MNNHLGISLHDINQLNNQFHHARSWEQTVDHLLTWMHRNFLNCTCIYVNVLPDSNNQINWTHQIPKTVFIPNPIMMEFGSLIQLFSESEPPILTIQQDEKKISPAINGWMKEANFQNLYVFPVTRQKDIIGLFVFACLESHKQGSLFDDSIFVQTLTLLFSNAADLQMRVSQSEKKILEMDQFIQIGLDLTESLNMEETLNLILEKALAFSEKSNNAHIFLYENENVQFGAAMYKDGSKGRVFSNPRKDGLTYSVARSGKLILVPDMSKHPLYVNTPEYWTGSIIGIPIMNHKTVVGVMTLAKLSPISFSQDEIDNLEKLADQAANVIQNIRTFDQIYLQAYTDPLTNLPNRRSFEWESQKLLEHSERYGHRFVIAMLDLNGFKRINDTYGHTVGDRALRVIADCIHSLVRKTDILARYGGDEFILLLPETDQDAALIVLEKLLTNIPNCPIPVAENQVESLTICYGLAAFPDDSSSITQLITLADKQLYLNKDSMKKKRKNQSG